MPLDLSMVTKALEQAEAGAEAEAETEAGG
jgi:hypothetical protein